MRRPLCTHRRVCYGHADAVTTVFCCRFRHFSDSLVQSTIWNCVFCGQAATGSVLPVMGHERNGNAGHHGRTMSLDVFQ